MSLCNSQVLYTPLVWVKADSANVSSRSEMFVCKTEPSRMCVCVKIGKGHIKVKVDFSHNVIKEYGGADCTYTSTHS
jgi:hypothetical protein